jgi:putative DNA primase/helicase
MTSNPEHRYNPSDFEPYLITLDEPSSGAKRAGDTSHNGAGHSPLLDDDTIIEKALNSKVGEKVARLWSGDISGYPSHSEADESFCWEMSFWTQTPEQINRLVRRSGLMRDKWDEHPSYAEQTIAKALQVRAKAEHYQGVSAEHNGQPHEEPHSSEFSDEPAIEDPPEAEIPIHLTDRGNALRLIKAYGQDLHYIYRWKKWLVWDGSRWAVDEGNLVEARAKQVIVGLYAEAQATIARVSKELETGNLGEDEQKKRAKEIDIATARLKWALKSESADRLAGMLRHARSERGIAITPEQLDGNPWILNCRNGTIDLKTGKLYKHRREDLCTKRIDVRYDPDAKCPQWNAFLWRIMGGPKPDEEGSDEGLNERAERAQRLINYLQRSTGYSLTGVIREQILQFMYGKGDNGKTTFSETLAALMGDYFQKAPQELLMRKARQQSNGPSPEIARLCGVRLVIAAEIDEKHRLNEAQVKDLTGDDTLTTRGLYEDYFEFKPTHKIWMYGNHKPVIVGTDDAIWKRPKLIPFTEKG